ncbi:MAG: hypothetical protein CL583_13240 [Alteromonadaceae bacterium]|nr:hypothetical protein [Alteromonadaceae bacterium]|tara:strand:+ start:304 stop:690 length:387 start_codon:yes stop_codon:yes gene_type:complete
MTDEDIARMYKRFELVDACPKQPSWRVGAFAVVFMALSGWMIYNITAITIDRLSDIQAARATLKTADRNPDEVRQILSDMEANRAAIEADLEATSKSLDRIEENMAAINACLEDDACRERALERLSRP